MSACMYVQVLEHVLNALIALIWNSPKNRIRMSNKEVIDLEILTKLAASGQVRERAQASFAISKVSFGSIVGPF